MKYNFNGFTDKGNFALNSAISEAEKLGHTYIGSEHLLLGILAVESGAAYSVLIENGVSKSGVESLLCETVGKGVPTKLSPDNFTPRAKRVIENAISGTRQLGSKLVGTEHILIGILGDGDNYAIRFLNELGVDVATITNKVLEIIGVSDKMQSGNLGEGGIKNDKPKRGG